MTAAAAIHASLTPMQWYPSSCSCLRAQSVQPHLRELSFGSPGGAVCPCDVQSVARFAVATAASCDLCIAATRCRALAAAVGAAPAFGAIKAARAEDAQGVASSRMSYSRFLEYLDMGRVKKVQASR